MKLWRSRHTGCAARSCQHWLLAGRTVDTRVGEAHAEHHVISVRLRAGVWRRAGGRWIGRRDMTCAGTKQHRGARRLGGCHLRCCTWLSMLGASRKGRSNLGAARDGGAVAHGVGQLLAQKRLHRRQLPPRQLRQPPAHLQQRRGCDHQTKLPCCARGSAVWTLRQVAWATCYTTSCSAAMLPAMPVSCLSWGNTL